MLREEAEWLKRELEAVNQRLAELEKAAGEPGR
jgi:prefoldin subunit 5